MSESLDPESEKRKEFLVTFPTEKAIAWKKRRNHVSQELHLSRVILTTHINLELAGNIRSKNDIPALKPQWKTGVEIIFCTGEMSKNCVL